MFKKVLAISLSLMLHGGSLMAAFQGEDKKEVQESGQLDQIFSNTENKTAKEESKASVKTEESSQETSALLAMGPVGLAGGLPGSSISMTPGIPAAAASGKLAEMLAPFIRETRHPSGSSHADDVTCDECIGQQKDPAKDGKKLEELKPVNGIVKAGEEPKKEEEPQKTFEEFVKGAKVIPGLFTIYQKEGKKEEKTAEKDKKEVKKTAFPPLKAGEKKYYMEIRPDQLGVNYHFLPTLEKGTGENGLFSTLMLYDKDFVWFLSRKNDKIRLEARNTNFRAQPGTDASKLVDGTFPKSTIVATVDVVEGLESQDKKSVLVDMNSLWMADWGGVGQLIGEAYGGGGGLMSLFRAPSPVVLDSANSEFESIESYPQNVELLLTLAFSNSSTSPAVIKKGPLFVSVRYSLSVLPDNGFEPREADDRVGNFVEVFQDYTDLKKGDMHRRLVNRWNLKKKNPYDAVSEVEKPVTYYLDANIPTEYREAIAAGVLAWNKAFEAAGLKGAIQVRDYPHNADWKPGDVRYSMIRWFTGLGKTYAVGPSRVNPFTGEIYHASISVSDWMARLTEREADDLSVLGSPGPRSKESFLKAASQMSKVQHSDHGAYCDLVERLTQEREFTLAALESRGELTPEVKKKFLDQFLTEVTAHEVGHTLGMRHNFKASAAYTLEDIQAGKTNGLHSGSVMDYLPANVAPKGTQQKGPYFQIEPGPYDKAVIAYAYTPLAHKTPKEKAEILSKIASRFSAEKELVYGTDEDRFAGKDPSTEVWDLGENPLDFQTQRIEQSREIWKTLEKPDSKIDYKTTRRYFSMGLSRYNYAMDAARRHLGGIEYRRDHVGDAGNRAPFEPVSAERQRQALAVFNDYVFKKTDKGALDFSPELLKKIAPENQPTLGEWPMPSPVSGNSLVESLRWRAFGAVYGPETLSRIKDSEKMTSKDKQAFSTTEVFDTVRNSVWSELDEKGKIQIDAQRQNLQQIHLDVMEILFTGDIGGPADTRILARNDLEEVLGKTEAALTRKDLDKSTRMHLKYVQGKAKKLLSIKD